ncbi:MAG: hypothetical protein A2V70_16425 [Planctomycetes bacterium RBG_13_63_9]|nr:MAG: hypothetical protein A2V70_16425 [Planctomycetes bacterium RBG_13_63_9]
MKRISVLAFLIVVASVTIRGTMGEDNAPQASGPGSRTPSAGSGTAKLPVFTDVTEQAGIHVKHSFGDFELSNIVEGTGAGAMFFDYDNDGWLDIYFLNGCWCNDVSDARGRRLRGKLANSLYRNNGDGTFTDVTEKAGVGDKSFGCGCSAADFDEDGDLDLYVLNYGPNVLYRNNGDGTFTNVSEASGLADPHWSLSAPWFDYDNDGDLDVYVVNYLEYDAGKFKSYYAAAGYPGPLSYSGQPDALYRNNGDGTFTNVTKEAGVYNPNGRGMSATVADLNNDGFLDVYVTNDGMENYFFRATGKGTFVSEGLELGLAFGEGGQGVSSMGPAAGDVDRDGRLDVYIPDMGYGCLLMNRGNFFEDRTAPSNLAVICGQYTGWGGLLLDYDNDGYLDVFVANGNAHHEYTEEDVLMRNDGKGNFVDVARESGDYFKQKFVGRGATYGDYDNDGDLDLLVVNLNDTPKLLRNDGGNANHWLTIDARLPGGKSHAIGARVTVRTGPLIQIRDLIPITGYLSQADPRMHFGLGGATSADMVEIRWQDGHTTRRNNVAANRVLTVVEDVSDEDVGDVAQDAQETE